MLEVDSVPSIQRFRLTVDGVNRGETDTHVSERWPGLQPTTIQINGDVRGLCIGPASSGHLAPVRMVSCNASVAASAHNLWTWNSDTKLLRNAGTGTCLGAVGGPSHVRMVEGCNVD